MNFGKGLYFVVFVIVGGKWDGEVEVLMQNRVVVGFNFLVVRSVVGGKCEGEAEVAIYTLVVVVVNEVVERTVVRSVVRRVVDESSQSRRIYKIFQFTGFF